MENIVFLNSERLDFDQQHDFSQLSAFSLTSSKLLQEGTIAGAALGVL